MSTDTKTQTSLKQKLRTKQVTVGSWLSFADVCTTEIMAKSGFEWLAVDMEHTAHTAHSMLRAIQITELAGCTPMVRVGANDPLLIKQAMDCGAHGVIVPMVNSNEEAERAAAAIHYPPRGTRGVGLWRAQRYGSGFEEYKEWASQRSVLIVQIEHWKAVDQLDEILDNDAVDGFMVGPYDLSGSIGYPGNFQNSKYLLCLEKIERSAKSHPKSAGFHIVHPDSSGETLRHKIAVGYTFIAYGTDMTLFTAGVESAIHCASM